MPTNSHADLLRRDLEPKRSLTLPVMGHRVTFETNSDEVLLRMRESYGTWQGLALSDDAVDLSIRVFEEEWTDGAGERSPFQYRVPDDDRRRTLIASNHSFGLADTQRHQALGYATPALVRDTGHFRYGFLEALTLSLITRFDRQPLHAAALVRDQKALLLCGPSGVGKSTLCYAAAQSGFEVLAEDMVFLQSHPEVRVWGMPGQFNLPESAVDRFPELAGHTTSVLANGKPKVVVPDPARHDTMSHDHVGICLLVRDGGAHDVVPISPDEAIHALTDNPEVGFDVFGATIESPVRRICERGGWRFTMSPSLDQSVAALAPMFDAL